MDKLDQIFSSGQIYHAYIFIGEGDDISLKALEFSKRILCETPHKSPCGVCNTCHRIDHKSYTDVLEIFPDGASIKIDQIREYILGSAQGPREGEKKIYILHKAHKMTPQAQNALLKTLEEPIGGVITLILTENIQQLLPTVISRCQVVDFGLGIASSVIDQDQKEFLARVFLSPKSYDGSSLKETMGRLMEDGGDLEVLDYVLSLYRDVLVTKSQEGFTLQNPDLKRQIIEASRCLSQISTIRALELIYRQRKAAKSRGNKNLLWYNLIAGLQEVT